ncbi:ComF family protein [Salinibacter altiplanensis]|uniref:ComF family protein n=1 Tax=Salinibacter altiplanensis TaxID=1803181 RepID=UPI001F3B9842|nr:ComF family protein [Salinibacter altiplanensis]
MRDCARGLLDVLYPPRCLGCGGRAESPRLPLCPTCLRSLERAPEMEVAARLDRLPAGKGVFEGAFALWIFDKGGTLQAVQHALKYQNRPHYGVPLGRLMGEAFAERHPIPEGVVPVPLHRTRRLERGYNQSATLAEGAGEALGCSDRPDLLTRPHPTRSQTGLDREARWRNVRDAFAADPAAAHGHWLLVDDVLTTGSTAVAAGETLAEAGAEALYLMTLGLARQ